MIKYILSLFGYHKIPKLPVEAIQMSMAAEDYFKNMVNSSNENKKVKEYFNHMLENQKLLTGVLRLIRSY